MLLFLIFIEKKSKLQFTIQTNEIDTQVFRPWLLWLSCMAVLAIIFPNQNLNGGADPESSQGF